MKTTPFRQTSFGNCGRYALANLFNEAAFIEDLEPGVGQNTHQLNRLLWINGLAPLYLSTDYQIPLGYGSIDNTSSWLTEDGWTSPGHCGLFVFIVAKDKHTHAIGGLLTCDEPENQALYIVDSLDSNVEKTTPNEFIWTRSVQGILNFRSEDLEGNGAALFDQKFYPHLIY